MGLYKRCNKDGTYLMYPCASDSMIYTDSEVSINTIGNAEIKRNFRISTAKALKKANVSNNRFITGYP
jgi:hypothetical protein